jgi:hypothetical protein
MADDLRDLPHSFETSAGIAPDQATATSSHIFPIHILPINLSSMQCEILAKSNPPPPLKSKG